MGEVIENCARYMNLYDVDTIKRWTIKEYQHALRGAQEQQIDRNEFMAKQAMAHGYANNAKRPKEHKIFNAKQARRNLAKGLVNNDKQVDRMLAINRKLKGFVPQFRKKKGG